MSPPKFHLSDKKFKEKFNINNNNKKQKLEFPKFKNIVVKELDDNDIIPKLDIIIEENIYNLISPVKNKIIEKPSEEKPSEEKPSEEKPSEEKPSEEKPAEEKPSEEKPSEEKPSEEKPSEEKPSEEKPSEEKPSEEKHVEYVSYFTRIKRFFYLA